MIRSLSWYSHWADHAARAESEGRFKFADRMTQVACDCIACELTPEDREAASSAFDDAYRASRRACDMQNRKHA
jgi:hypothetical protein